MDLPLAEGMLEVWVRRAAARRPVESLASLHLPSVQRVLLVLTTGLGDAVLSTPAFQAVRRALPQARIALFVRNAWAPLFHAERDVDEVIGYHGKWRRFFSTLGRLRSFSPELTLVLHGNDPDVIPLAYLAGSRHIVRVPTAGTRFGRLLSNSQREQDKATVDGLHYIENRLRVLETVGIAPVLHVPAVHLSDAQIHAARAWVERQIGRRAFIVVHRHAADRYKTWPRAKAMEFLRDALSLYPDLGVVLTGAGADRGDAAEMAAPFPSGRVVVAAGTFDIGGTAGLITLARAVVAPDTGILHLAAALDVPTIGLFSPTRPALVGPRARTASVVVLVKGLTCTPCEEKRCPHNPALCMAQFSGAEVLRALAETLVGP